MTAQRNTDSHNRTHKQRFKEWMKEQRRTRHARATKNPKGHLAMQILYWMLIASIAFFAYLNINPYQIAVSMVLGNIDGSGFLNLVANLPVLGALVTIASASLNWILGAILWLVIQILEISPMLLERDSKYMSNLIQETEDHDVYDVRDDDDPLLGRMKRSYNAIPIKHYRDFKQLAFFAYTIDFLICFAVYPPVEGGFGKFFYVLLSGQFSLIDWRNVALAIATLFAIEALLKIIFMVGSVAFRIETVRGWNHE